MSEQYIDELQQAENELILLKFSGSLKNNSLIKYKR